MLGTTTRTVEVDADYLSQSAYGRVRLGMDCNIARTGLALVGTLAMQLYKRISMVYTHSCGYRASSG